MLTKHQKIWIPHELAKLADTRTDTQMAHLPSSTPQFFTVAEVADMTRVSRMTVYRMVHSGELPAVRVGNSYRVPKSAVDQLLTGGAAGDFREATGF